MPDKKPAQKPSKSGGSKSGSMKDKK